MRRLGSDNHFSDLLAPRLTGPMRGRLTCGSTGTQSANAKRERGE
jgi:hypothetical protein